MYIVLQNMRSYFGEVEDNEDILGIKTAALGCKL
jgi:hypothetical protein